MKAFTLNAYGRTEKSPDPKRVSNQDSYHIQHPGQRESTEMLCLVADGVSELKKGDLASQIGTDQFQQMFSAKTNEGVLSERVYNALFAAHDAIRQQSQIERIEKMGTTITGVVLAPNGRGLIFNVGDSRVYRVRGRSIRQLTQDQVRMSEDDTKPKKLLLVGFLGQNKPLEPELQAIQARPKDRYIICTDGVSSKVTPNEIKQLVRSEAADALVDTILKLVAERKGSDDATLILVTVDLESHQIRWQVVIGAVVLALILALFLVVMDPLALNVSDVSPNITSTPITTSTPEPTQIKSTTLPTNAFP